MNQGITPSVWYVTSWGVGTYLSGNRRWASLISLALVGFGFPPVWGIPLICWGAVVSLVYPGILFYLLIFTGELEDSNGQSWIRYGVVWILGILWYFFLAARSQRVGVDVSMTYGERRQEWACHISHVGGRSRRCARGYEIGIRPRGRKRLRDGPSRGLSTGAAGM